MKQSISRRILSGIGGQALSRATFLLSTVAIIPILLSAWGTQTYGEWLTLTAFASYVSLSDFGLSNATSTEMIRLAGAGELARARSVFDTSLTSLLFISIPVLGAIVVPAYCLPLTRWLNISSTDNTGAFLVITLVAINVWLNTLKGVIAGAICTTGRYGLPNTISAIAKLFELTCLGVSAIYFQISLLGAAVIICVAAALDVACQIFIFCRLVEWAGFTPRINKKLLQKLVRPSLGVVTLNMAVNAASIQGPRLILSAIIGPSAVTVYSLYGTAMRLVDQLTGLFAAPLQMEVANSTGAGDEHRSIILVALGTQLSLIGYFCVVAGLLLFGDWIFAIWTHKLIAFHFNLMALFLLIGLAMQIGKVAQIYLLGTNEVFHFAMIALISMLTSLGLGAILLPYLGLPGMVIAMAMGETAMTVAALSFCAHIMQISLGSLLSELANFSKSARLMITFLHRRKILPSKPIPNGNS